MEYEKNADNQLNKMTKFIHSEYQKCAEWTPNSQIGHLSSWEDIGVMIPSHPYSGIAGHGNYNINEYKKFIESDFELHNAKYVINDVSWMKIDGAASSKSQKLLYTCQVGQCLIHCPYNLCNGRRSQCSHHKLNMTRLFNSETDQYTLVTSLLPEF